MTSLFCPRCDRRLTPDHKCLSRRWFLASLSAAYFPFGTLPRGDILCTFDFFYTTRLNRWDRELTETAARWLSEEARRSGRSLSAPALLSVLDKYGRTTSKLAAPLYSPNSPRAYTGDFTDAKWIKITPEMIFGKDSHVLPALR